MSHLDLAHTPAGSVLPESGTAISTSTYSFTRSFGFVWGATIPSIIFNGPVDVVLSSIDYPSAGAALAHGGVYSYTLAVRNLTGTMRRQMLGFLLVFVERHVHLRVTPETGFGLGREKPDKREVQHRGLSRL
ncbi:hypothetical protein C8A03DRAFT_38307 [Achaetomium macrosporum]|uniref:Uncharacterized protein n=1 Tax=Achaetomium macrosporum TaxID=79813 RepID=A0AAN7H420_9PEZI|nr:hypothetical protein C8A03DRAFT_38307 [Achaetomium macrosporum]